MRRANSRHPAAPFVLAVIALIVGLFTGGSMRAQDETMLIDDFADPSLTSTFGTQWRGVSDMVMGGVSQASVTHSAIDGERCLRLSGDVSLENNGGFIQAALDLAADGQTFDAAEFAGVSLVVSGNGEQYSLHLRTSEVVRPWQSYRAHFVAGPDLRELKIPFSEFEPYRLEAPLDVTKLRRIGLVAIGREFEADLSICQLALYR